VAGTALTGGWRRGRKVGLWGALALIAGGSGACSKGPEPLDLLRGKDHLVEATAAGQAASQLAPLIGKAMSLYDVTYRVLPAGPPGRLRFHLDLPKATRLTISCAIAAERQTRPGVEFVVKARRGKTERVLTSRLLNPMTVASDRGFVPLDVDLRDFAGRDVDLILETHGFEATDDPLSAAWGAPAVTVAHRDAPLTIIYLVDTLRADHTGVYGYRRNTTPELDTFAKDAVIFEQAISQASWTKPAVASILTSLPPGQHRAVQLRDTLDPSHTTIAKMLSDHGTSTGAAIANSVIYLPESGFSQGFDVFEGLHDESGLPSKLVGAEGVVNAALSWLDRRQGLPRFLYVHTMDPHVPYAPPPPFDQLFEPHPLPGRPAADPRTDYREPADRDRMMAQYDGDIAYGDQEFGRFVRELKSRGLYDRALLIFLADHGEEFQDHGQWLHGRSVFDELVRVPLVVKFPGQRSAGMRVAQQVQAVDVVPTILEELKIPAPPNATLAGKPLQSVVQGGAARRPAVSEISHRGIVAHGVRTEADKYIRRFGPEQDELYFNLLKDPKERENVIEAAPERVRLLRGAAEAAMAPNPFRHALRISGAGVFDLVLRTGGWIEEVASEGLGTADRQQLQQNGRRLELHLLPRADQPREISFSVRPMGAPVYLEGRRDGRPLRTSELRVAEKGSHPDALPYRLPDLEGETDHPHHLGNLFAAPSDPTPGIGLWLMLPPGRKLLELDTETRERLKALGYVGQ
jgi:arylsulfatase A-like enzyme